MKHRAQPDLIEIGNLPTFMAKVQISTTFISTFYGGTP
jgi:hypothetical protein